MDGSYTAASSDDVRGEYSARQHAHAAIAASCHQRCAWALMIFIGSIALVVLLFFMGIGVHAVFAFAVPILVIAASWQMRLFLRFRRGAVNAAHRAAFYERGMDRINGHWAGKGNVGIAFMRDRHLYQNDLDIIGEGSLFELLATTRSDAGAERLASYLLDPTSSEEARRRQEAVKELRFATALREEIDVIGKYRFQDCSPTRLRGWLDEPLLQVPKQVPVLLAGLSLLSLALMVAGAAQLYSWTVLAPMLAVSLAGQGALSLALMRQVRTRIEVLRTLASDVSVLRAGIEIVAREKFTSPKLRAIAESLSSEDAGKGMISLERLLTAIERREDAILYGILVWFAAGTQLVLALERWRARYQQMFETWIFAWAEFEALSALASYAYEHPGDVFPDLIDGGANFEAQEMGHPLLSAATCVTNDIALSGLTRFYIISGSNMAGKSTLLRGIGLNAVLAAAGAPVRAKQARIAVMTICASIGIGDSLRDGASKFFAEIDRLRNSITKARQGKPVLFLIDEMLAGTNSRDRCIAAEWILEELIAAGAAGALSTHDLALTEITHREARRGVNVHMQSRSEDDPLDFDYRLRPGIANQTNGLAIVRMMGLQV